MELIHIISILTICGGVQGLFLAFLLLRLKKGNIMANRWLAAFLMVFALEMMGVVLHKSGWILKVPFLAYWYAPLTLIQGQFFYLYICEITQAKHSWNRWPWLHFIPFFLGVLFFLPVYLQPVSEKSALLREAVSDSSPFFIHFSVTSLCITAIYIFITFLTIKQHTRSIHRFYSSEKGKTLIWFHYIFGLLVGIFIICVVLSFVIGMLNADMVSNFLFSIVIYFIGYKAMINPEIIPGFETIIPALAENEVIPAVIRVDQNEVARYEKSGLTREKADEAYRRLESVMRDEKAFLDPELDLKILSEKINLSTHQLSQLLNQYAGETFFDYVNHYRVNYFIRLLHQKDLAHLSLLGLAYESGFNSKSTFNSVFKKFTGKTPSEFKKNPN